MYDAYLCGARNSLRQKWTAVFSKECRWIHFLNKLNLEIVLFQDRPPPFFYSAQRLSLEKRFSFCVFMGKKIILALHTQRQFMILLMIALPVFLGNPAVLRLADLPCIFQSLSPLSSGFWVLSCLFRTSTDENVPFGCVLAEIREHSSSAEIRSCLLIFLYSLYKSDIQHPIAEQLIESFSRSGYESHRSISLFF